MTLHLCIRPTLGKKSLKEKNPSLQVPIHLSEHVFYVLIESFKQCIYRLYGETWFTM